MDKSHDILVNNLIQRLDELKILLSDVLIENAENLEDIVDYIAIMILYQLIFLDCSLIN